jgi:putative flippase GtrA
VVRFALNDRWTFQDRRNGSLTARFYQHNFGSLGSPIICLAAVNILTPFLGLSYLIANSVGILLGLVWNWFWSIRVVWAGMPLESTREGTRVEPSKALLGAPPPLARR